MVSIHKEKSWNVCDEENSGLIVSSCAKTPSRGKKIDGMCNEDMITRVVNA